LKNNKEEEKSKSEKAREKKQLQTRERKCHTLWYLPRKIRNATWRES